MRTLVLLFAMLLLTAPFQASGAMPVAGPCAQHGEAMEMHEPAHNSGSPECCTHGDCCFPVSLITPSSTVTVQPAPVVRRAVPANPWANVALPVPHPPPITHLA